MADVKSVLALLKKKGNEKTRQTYARHGMEAERTYGVSAADMKAIAKNLKGQQALACELYSTGVMEAMYVAGMVADGAQLTEKQLDEWAEGAAGMQMVAEYTVPWVAVENSHRRELALRWMKSDREHVAAAGWCTYVCGDSRDDAGCRVKPGRNREVNGDSRKGNRAGAQPGAVHDECVRDFGGNVCEAAVEKGEGGGGKAW
ncbi:MAG TPA: DNA alkylation repair protein [Candidatus Methylomirabilis sp.]|nr:DNA alkylation repair protein [Candidatus Methylomirabilis sp.]